MGTSCRVLGKGQGTFCMDKRKKIYPQERSKGWGRKDCRLDLDQETQRGETQGDTQRQKSK